MFDRDPLGLSFRIGAVDDRSVHVWARIPRLLSPWVEVVERGEARRTRLDASSVDRDWITTADLDVEWVRGSCELFLGDGERQLAGPIRVRLPSAMAEGPTEVVFASCHQPFDRAGEVPTATRFWLDQLADELDRRRPDRVFLIGDQVYLDLPDDVPEFIRAGPESFDGDAERSTVREYARERHRRFFGVEGFRRILESHPTQMMLDDHEVFDNFGTEASHREARLAPWVDGALDATREYQLSRPGDGLPERGPFHFEIDLGALGGFVCDLRSQRRREAKHAVLGTQQARDFESWLERTRDKALRFLVLTVPPVHLPASMGKALGRLAGHNNEFRDRWESPGFVEERSWLLDQVDREQRLGAPIHLVAGDVHAGGLQFWERSPSSHPILQVISSAVSHRMPWWGRMAALLSLRVPSMLFEDRGLRRRRASQEHTVRGPLSVTSRPNIASLRLDPDGPDRMRYRWQQLVPGARLARVRCELEGVLG